jgi:3-phenylpropionate/cinnamic acid dioxygenase small subunit
MNATTRREAAPHAVVDDVALVDFVYAEARAIDEKRFDDWYEMFADDARYWLPLTRGQPDGILHTSLMYEDKLLLKVRIERLRSPNAFSQAQPSHCQHVLQAPRVERRDPASNLYVVRTPFLYVEAREERQDVFAGVAWHHLAQVDGRLRIRLKKVELVNCDAPLPSIQLFP